MMFSIMPQDVQRADNTNDLVVKTIVPKDAFDDNGALLISHIRRHRASAGDHVRVLGFDYTRDNLLWMRTWVVTKAVTEQKRVVVNDQEQTTNETVYQVRPLTEFWDAPGAGVTQAVSSLAPASAAPLKQKAVAA